MWVRSQDIEKLINCESFVILECEDYNYRIADNLHFQTLGIYSTKADALKVLDEIQRVIFKKEFSLITNQGTSKDNIIFQMPQDSEVE